MESAGRKINGKPLKGKGDRLELIIGEKPSVAKNIATAVHARYNGKGYYENNAYMVTNCVGHLCSLAMPEDYDSSLKKWDLSALPIIPETFQFKIAENTKKQFLLVKQLMMDSRVTGIINACDGDREGEHIFRLVYQMAGCTKPVQRLWVSSQEPDAISSGLQSLKPMSFYDNLAEAAWSREVADWVVGINLSRLYTLSLDARQKMPVGRVKTPTVNMIVQRELEIRNFKPSDYWILKANLGDFFLSRRCDEEEEMREILRVCNGRNAVIRKMTKSKKKDPNPRLYNLTALQQDCSKYFGLSALETLNVLQSLYERKFATYPRTESIFLTDKDKSAAQKVVDSLKDHPLFLSAHGELCRLNLDRVTDDSKVEGHPALLPTVSGIKAYDGLSGNEKNIMTLLIFRLLESTTSVREYISVQVVAEIEGYEFTGAGTIETVEGWKSFDAQKRKMLNLLRAATKKAEQSFPELKSGDSFAVKGITSEKKQTTPPARYTDATILEAMESCGRRLENEEQREAMKGRGLGTPATRAGILEQIVWTESNPSGYITRGCLERGKWKDTRHLYPTKQAEAFMALLPDRLKSPDTTGAWEYELLQIQKGKAEKKPFLNEIERFVSDMVSQAKTNPFTPEQRASFAGDGVTTKAEDKLLCACPKCGGNIVPYRKVKDKDGNKLPAAKTGYRCTTKGCAVIISDKINGKKLAPSIIKKLMTTGTTGILNGFISSKTGNKFSAEIVTERGEDGKMTGKFKFQLPERKILCQCPLCGKNITAFRFQKKPKSGEKPSKKQEFWEGWGCENRDCALHSFYNPYYGRLFSEDEVRELFTSGATHELAGFSNAVGDNAKGTVVLHKNPDGFFSGSFGVEWDKNTEVCDCPVCHKGKIAYFRTARGYAGYKCTNRSCTLHPLYNPYCGHDFTPEQVLQLFTLGRTDMFYDFVSKKGKNFSAKIACSRNEDGSIDGQEYIFEWR